MAVDLAHRVQDYAYKLVAVHVKEEYESQISDWTKHVNSLVGYAKTAHQNHERVLTEAKERQRADHEFTMLALSFLAGPALSWLSGAIQYKLVPQFLGKRKVTSSYVVVKPQGKHFHEKELVWDPHVHNKTTAKVFGDFGSTLSQALLVNPTITAVAPDTRELKRKTDLIGASVSLEVFETNVRNALEEGKKMGGKAIINYAGTILADREFGDKWVAKLKNEQPSLRDDGLREEALRRMLRVAVDKQRREWAEDKKWLYYGHYPQALPPLLTTNAIETEIWAMWILAEGFRVELLRGHERLPERDRYYLIHRGASDISLNDIYHRLVELGVAVGRDEDEMHKKFRIKLDAEQKGKDPGLLDTEIFDIEGKVDTAQEYRTILEWAAKRRPKVLNGHMSSIKRTISPTPASLSL